MNVEDFNIEIMQNLVGVSERLEQTLGIGIQKIVILNNNIEALDMTIKKLIEEIKKDKT